MTKSEIKQEKLEKAAQKLINLHGVNEAIHIIQTSSRKIFSERNGFGPGPGQNGRECEGVGVFCNSENGGIRLFRNNPVMRPYLY